MRPRPLENPDPYCPRCGTTRAGDSSLCPGCGESWTSPGYCSTCERYWSLPEGVECPKHGLPLDACPQDEASAGWPADVPLDWVTVETYPHPYAAQAARIRLDAEGIPTFLEGARMGENTLYQNATGGVKLQVPRALQSDARILLSQSWAAPTEIDEAEDEEWEEPIRVIEVADDPGPQSPARPIAMATVGLCLAAIAWAAWTWLGSR
ncbi:MAG: hypothetical protein U0800_09365 [Isosphaeraceae bacterium]